MQRRRESEAKRLSGERSTASKAAYYLYLAHFLLELVLGALKLRGTYSGIDMSCAPGSAKFARHHGVSLLAIALLGGEVLRRRMCDSVTGEVASFVLASFHTGCVLVMLHAINLKVVAIHAPFAIGFWWHYASRVRGKE